MCIITHRYLEYCNISLINANNCPEERDETTCLRCQEISIPAGFLDFWATHVIMICLLGLISSAMNDFFQLRVLAPLPYSSLRCL